MVIKSLLFTIMRATNLLSLLQVADVWLRDANEARGTAGRRLFLHWLPVFRSHCVRHRPRYAHSFLFFFMLLQSTGWNNYQTAFILIISIPECSGEREHGHKGIIKTLQSSQSRVQCENITEVIGHSYLNHDKRSLLSFFFQTVFIFVSVAWFLFQLAHCEVPLGLKIMTQLWIKSQGFDKELQKLQKHLFFYFSLNVLELCSTVIYLSFIRVN